MDKKELALKLHGCRYNCAQAVACAFSEEIGVEERVIFRACEGFGLGMGSMEGNCGALTGAIMLAGWKKSDGNLEAPASKAATYRLAKEMTERFREKAGATVCRDLKGVDTGTVLCSCRDCVRIGAEVAEEVLGL